MRKDRQDRGRGPGGRGTGGPGGETRGPKTGRRPDARGKPGAGPGAGAGDRPRPPNRSSGPDRRPERGDKRTGGPPVSGRKDRPDRERTGGAGENKRFGPSSRLGRAERPDRAATPGRQDRTDQERGSGGGRSDRPERAPTSATRQDRPDRARGGGTGEKRWSPPSPRSGGSERPDRAPSSGGREDRPAGSSPRPHKGGGGLRRAERDAKFTGGPTPVRPGGADRARAEAPRPWRYDIERKTVPSSRPDDRPAARRGEASTPARRPAPRPPAGPRGPVAVTEHPALTFFGSMRISKALARAGLCSRRDAERWIAEGRVKVNGRLLTSPALDVEAKDRIEVDGKPLPTPEPPQLWRYHKPRGLVTTHKDPEGRPTVFDALPPELPRVVSVGRATLSSNPTTSASGGGGSAGSTQARSVPA